MSYTSIKLFSDPKVNTIVDNFYYYCSLYLSQELESEDNLDEVLVLSGKGASILQVGDAVPLNNICFVTSSADVFKYFKETKDFLYKKIVFKNKVLFVADGICVEFHYFDGEISLFAFKSIKLQLKSQIPAELL